MNKQVCLLIFVIFFYLLNVSGQGITDWDNQLFFGNKVASSKGSWRYSGELQIRLKDNTHSLDQWYVEGMLTYQINKHWEIAPDLRFTVKPTKNEWRPGFGVVFKHYIKKKVQFAHQFKYQIDIEPGRLKHALRYVAFFNYLLHEKFVPNAAFGIFYRWQDDFTGVQFYRAGVGLAYIINVQHSLNFSYFVGFTDTSETWEAQGMTLLQLIININKDYKYVPAKYFNF